MVCAVEALLFQFIPRLRRASQEDIARLEAGRGCTGFSLRYRRQLISVGAAVVVVWLNSGVKDLQDLYGQCFGAARLMWCLNVSHFCEPAPLPGLSSCFNCRRRVKPRFRLRLVPSSTVMPGCPRALGRLCMTCCV